MILIVILVRYIYVKLLTISVNYQHNCMQPTRTDAFFRSFTHRLRHHRTTHATWQRVVSMILNWRCRLSSNTWSLRLHSWPLVKVSIRAAPYARPTSDRLTRVNPYFPPSVETKLGKTPYLIPKWQGNKETWTTPWCWPEHPSATKNKKEHWFTFSTTTNNEKTKRIQ